MLFKMLASIKYEASQSSAWHSEQSEPPRGYQHLAPWQGAAGPMGQMMPGMEVESLGKRGLQG